MKNESNFNSFYKIYDLLKNSFNYIDFINTYNSMIPEITKLKKENCNLWGRFIKAKNKLKAEFYKRHCQEYPDIIFGELKKLSNIYDLTCDELDKIAIPIEKIININLHKNLLTL